MRMIKRLITPLLMGIVILSIASADTLEPDTRSTDTVYFSSGGSYYRNNYNYTASTNYGTIGPYPVIYRDNTYYSASSDFIFCGDWDGMTAKAYLSVWAGTSADTTRWITYTYWPNFRFKYKYTYENAGTVTFKILYYSNLQPLSSVITNSAVMTSDNPFDNAFYQELGIDPTAYIVDYEHYDSFIQECVNKYATEASFSFSPEHIGAAAAEQLLVSGGTSLATTSYQAAAASVVGIVSSLVASATSGDGTFAISDSGYFAVKNESHTFVSDGGTYYGEVTMYDQGDSIYVAQAPGSILTRPYLSCSVTLEDFDIFEVPALSAYNSAMDYFDQNYDDYVDFFGADVYNVQEWEPATSLEWLQYYLRPTFQWQEIDYDDFLESMGILALPIHTTSVVLNTLKETTYRDHLILNVDAFELTILGEEFTVIPDFDVDFNPTSVFPASVWSFLQYLAAFTCILGQAYLTYCHLFRNNVVGDIQEGE